VRAKKSCAKRRVKKEKKSQSFVLFMEESYNYYTTRTVSTISLVLSSSFLYSSERVLCGAGGPNLKPVKIEIKRLIIYHFCILRRVSVYSLDTTMSFPHSFQQQGIESTLVQ
jgi:hypothetical protein